MTTKRPKTIFCDIDGTLIKHFNATPKKQMETIELLQGTMEKFSEWDRKGYNIILTTGRRESSREITEKKLSDAGLFWDHLVMGIGGGDRILINDKKPNSDVDTVFAINVKRNEGIKNVKI